MKMILDPLSIRYDDALVRIRPKKHMLPTIMSKKQAGIRIHELLNEKTLCFSVAGVDSFRKAFSVM